MSAKPTSSEVLDNLHTIQLSIRAVGRPAPQTSNWAAEGALPISHQRTSVNSTTKPRETDNRNFPQKGKAHDTRILSAN